MAIWRFHFLGKEVVVDPSGRVCRLPAIAWPALGLLFAAPGRRLGRSTLGGLLWPDVEESVARHRLATILWRLRQAMPCFEALVVATDRELTLSLPGNVWIDVLWLIRRCERVLADPDCLDRKIERLRVLRALRLHQGTFLAQHDHELLLIERERIRALYLDAGYLLASANLRHGEWNAAIEIGRTLCVEEPLREDVQRLLISSLDRAGQRPLAIQQYHRLETILQEEIGVRPMPESRALYARLLGRPADPPSSLATESRLEPGPAMLQPSSARSGGPDDRERQLLEQLHAQVKSSLSLIESALGY